jgi:hypothetical protein
MYHSAIMAQELLQQPDFIGPNDIDMLHLSSSFILGYQWNKCKNYAEILSFFNAHKIFKSSIQIYLWKSNWLKICLYMWSISYMLINCPLHLYPKHLKFNWYILLCPGLFFYFACSHKKIYKFKIKWNF